MVRRHVLLAVLALAVAPACASSGQPQIELGPAIAAAPQGGVSQVVLEVANTGDGADRLVAVDTEAALGAEIHRTVADAAAGMEPIAAVDIPPGERVMFEQEGLHLMLIAPRHTVAPGRTFELVLDFERSGRRRVQVEVLALADLRL